MIKPIHLLLVTALLISCGKNKTKNEAINVVNIKYSNEINGFTVSVVWQPNVVTYNFTKGPAIIEFYNLKDSTSFTVTNNHFAIANSKLPFNFSEDSTEITSINQPNIQLVYDEKNIKTKENFGTTNEPFFFQDVDFDDEKELITVEFGNGQRGVASFKAYQLAYGSLQPEMNDITYTEPFKSLDELSTIDYVNKRVIIYGSGGACANSVEVYNLVSSQNDYDGSKLVLNTIIEEERDDNLGKCYELRYLVVNQSKQLISKKESD